MLGVGGTINLFIIATFPFLIVAQHVDNALDVFKSNPSSLLLVYYIECAFEFPLGGGETEELVHHYEVFEGQRTLLLHIMLLEDTLDGYVLFGDDLVEGGNPFLQNQFLVLTLRLKLLSALDHEAFEVICANRVVTTLERNRYHQLLYFILA